LTFLSPVMLWAALGAGVPVIIHLASRAKPDVVPLPTVRFLSRARSADRAKLKLKQLLLLAMRMLAIALFAFILARPCTRLFGLSALGAAARGPAVVVLDRSASMAYAEGDRTRFDLAKELSAGILAVFDEESEVALVVAGDPPRSARSKPTIDHDAVKGELASTGPGWERSDLTSAVRLAGKMLRANGSGARGGGGGGGGRGAVFVVTDMTRAAWPRRPGGPGGAGAPGRGAGEACPPVHVFDVSRTGSANGAVASVDLPSRRLAAGATVEVTASVLAKRRGAESLVELLIDGAKADHAVLEAGGGRYSEARLTFTAPAGGAHRGEVRLAEVDALAADNTRHFVFGTGDVLRALLVEAGPAARASVKEARGSLFYLDKALAPDVLLGAAPVETKRVGALELETSPLSRYDCVVLSDGGAGMLSEDSWKALARYVEGGGGLLVTLGPMARLDDLRRRSFDAIADRMGLLPGVPREAVVTDERVSLAPARFEHPLLRIFRGGANGGLDAATFGGYVRMEREAADTASHVVLSFSNGEPALLEKRYGRGVVMVFASSLDPRWGDLPRRMSFVPLAHQLVRYLSPRSEELGELEVGESASISTPGGLEGGAYEILAPSRRWRKVALAGAESVSAFRTEPLAEPGVWRARFRRRGAAAESTHMFAVNLPASESDLSRIEPEEIADITGMPVRAYSSLDEFAAAAASGGATEVTAWLWPLLLLLIVLEGFAANRMYRPAGDGDGAGDGGGGEARPGRAPR